MGYGARGCKESDTTEVTEPARKETTHTKLRSCSHGDDILEGERQ